MTLRYGNALDSLFHRAVVITEGDRDSHFFVRRLMRFMRAYTRSLPHTT